MINFVFTIARRTVLQFEKSVDAANLNSKNIQTSNLAEKGKPSGTSVSIDTRNKVQEKNAEAKDAIGLNLVLALVLYNISVSCYNQVEPLFKDVDEMDAQEFEHNLTQDLLDQSN